MKQLLKKSSNFNPIKTLILILVLTTNWVFSQKKMMVHPSIGLTVSPFFHLFEKNSTLEFNRYSNFEIGGFIGNKFLTNKNSLDLRLGFNWNNKSYLISQKGNLSSNLIFTEFNYLNVPILLSFSFDKHRILKPFISSGFSFGYVKKANRRTTLFNGETITGFGSSQEIYKNPIYFNLSFGANIQCNKQISISIEPFYKHTILGTSAPSPDRTIIKSLGLRFGCFYKLPDFEWK